MQREARTSSYDYIVLGTGVAGAAAVETLRQGDRFARIALIGDEPYLMYYRPRLPGYVAGHVPRSSIVLPSGGSGPFNEREAGWASSRHVDALLGTPATSVDPESRLVYLADGRALRFGSLLLASGARPRRLGIPGERLDAVRPLWTVADAEALRAEIAQARRAVTIGGGFIGAELTEALRLRGLSVTYLCRGPWWHYPFLDEAGGRLVAAELHAEGIDARFGVGAVRILGERGRATSVQTDQGEELAADLVTYSLGPERNLGYLDSSGIAASASGVLTDEWLQTSSECVWAAGAIADVDNPTAGRRVNLHNVPTAASQGRMAALGMLGRPQQLLRVPQYGFRLLGLSLTFVGLLDSTDPTLDSFVCDRSPRAYARIFVRGGRIAGGIMINSSRAGEVRRLVEARAPAPADPRRLLARLIQ